LVSDLVEPGFLQRDRDETAGPLQRFHGALRGTEISAQQNQDRRLCFQRDFDLALKASARARRVSMEIRRRMRQRRLAGSIRKSLRFIATTRI
jgi:hypothetical protein